MTNLERWVADLSEEFGFDPADIDIAAVLSLAADAAHNVERPAAPLTTYIAGFVAGKAGAGDAADIVARAAQYSVGWSAEPELAVDDKG